MGSSANFIGPNNSNPAAHIQQFIQGLEVTKEDLDKAAEYLIQAIRSRTLAGESLDGSDFIEYSPAYLVKSKKSDNVNLYGVENHEHMLDSLSHRVQEGFNGQNLLEVGIFDDSLASIAMIQDRGATVKTKSGKKTRLDVFPFFQIPERKFLGIQPSELEKVNEIIGESIAYRIGENF